MEPECTFPEVEAYMSLLQVKRIRLLYDDHNLICQKLHLMYVFRTSWWARSTAPRSTPARTTSATTSRRTTGSSWSSSRRHSKSCDGHDQNWSLIHDTWSEWSLIHDLNDLPDIDYAMLHIFICHSPCDKDATCMTKAARWWWWRPDGICTLNAVLIG